MSLRVRRLGLIAAVGLGLASHALAAEGLTPPPPPPDLPEEPAPEGSCDAADAVYRDGVDQFAHGNNARAADRFRAVLEQCPTHPSAAEMLRVAEERSKVDLENRRDLINRGFVRAQIRRRAPPPPNNDEFLTRGELVVGQAVHGIFQGFLGCQVIGCRDSTLSVGLPVLGGALGGVAAYFLSVGIDPGLADALNSGTMWGAWFAGMAVGMTNTSGSTEAAIFQAGMAVGLAGGLGFGLSLHPGAGQVSLVNSGGIWAAFLGGLVAAAANVSTFGGNDTLWMLLLGSSVGGMTIGAALAAAYPMSRGRVLLIDAGGLIGTLLGLAVAALFASGSSGSSSGGIVAAGAGLGAMAGLAASTALTGSVDESTAQNLAFSPIGPGGNLGAMVGLRF